MNDEVLNLSWEKLNIAWKVNSEMQNEANLSEQIDVFHMFARVLFDAFRNKCMKNSHYFSEKVTLQHSDFEN